VIRIAKLVIGLFAVWMLLLLVLGFALAGRTQRAVAARIGDSLQASSTIGDASLGLVGGSFTFEKLAVRRDDLIGRLSLDVGEVRCDLPPLGLALVDRTCGPLEIAGVRLEVSSAALFKIKRPKKKPFTADRVVVDDAKLVFLASALAPSLGQVVIEIEHARAGPTTFKTPLSFLFALEELRAVVELPAGITLRLAYQGGRLAASGSLFGAKPIELPITLPVIDSADDAQAEIAKLVAFGRDLAQRLVTQRAEDWLKQRLPIP